MLSGQLSLVPNDVASQTFEVEKRLAQWPRWEEALQLVWVTERPAGNPIERRLPQNPRGARCLLNSSSLKAHEQQVQPHACDYG